MSSASPASPPTKPLAIEHLKQARRNYKLYQELKTRGEHLDWAMIVLFYTVLHLVQAYFVEVTMRGMDIPKDHDRRLSLVHQQLRLIGSDYEYLQKRSMDARYRLDLKRPTPESLQQCEDRQFARIVADLKARGYDLHGQ